MTHKQPLKHRRGPLLLATATLAVVGGTVLPRPSFGDGSAPPQKSSPKPVAIRDGAAYYTQKVLPILTTRCLTCHSGSDGMGGLDMTSRAAILKGGTTGPAVNLDKPADSLIVRYIGYHEAHKMPPQGKLPQAEIDVLTRWVTLGMPFPDAKNGAASASQSLTKVNATTKNWWAFRPVKRQTPPTVKNTAWVRNPIDNFVLAKLEKSGLKPATPASRTALLRRVTYDMTGLPPTPAEVSAFLNDKSPNAYEKVVDRLLASPHYGERWGRHWLDLVRWAETNSFERDDSKPFAWRYRDYVIRAFNTDMPYDRFLREQLAGDELDTVTPDTIIATGYYRLGQWDDEPADPEQALYDELDDLVATTSQTMLGITVNCARCHDHKIDPIPQKDYYSLAAFFQGVVRYGNRIEDAEESVQRNSLTIIASDKDRKKFAGEEAIWRGKMDAATASIVAVENKVNPDLSPVEKEEWNDEGKRAEIIAKRVGKIVTEEELTTYKTQFEAKETLRRNPPAALAQALAVKEVGKPLPPFNLMERGNPHAPGVVVTPAFPSVLSPPAPVITPRADGKSSGRRLALANWVASPKNPLTARVMANRVFQYHFGRGIVRSSSNFGRLGDQPTHPELLDYLASELVRNGWRLKPLHRAILLSSAYRMSSQGNKVALAKDPENNLLWRFDMRRLEAEEVRDSILAANGTLNPKMYGPSIYPTIPQEVLAGQSIPGHGWGKNTPEEQARRSIYVHIKRSLGVPALTSFDTADTDFTCPVRFATTQPTQALSLINSTFLNGEAGQFAGMLRKKAPGDLKRQVSLGLWQVTQRPPKPVEIERGLKFLSLMEKEQGVSKDESLRRFCVVLLNLNEFIYLD